jgi:hypothetical protein
MQTRHKKTNRKTIKMNKLRIGAAVAAILLLFAGQATGQPVQLKDIIVPKALGDFSYFGGKVSIDGNYLAASSHYINPIRKSKGSGYGFIYAKKDYGWHLVSRVDGYGAVALSGDYMAVDAGYKVHIAHRESDTNWVVEDTIQNPDGNVNYYANCLDMHGDYLIISSSRDNEEAKNAGAAYVYRRDNSDWHLEKKLTASDAGRNARFGGSVSIHDNYALVGAYNAQNTSDLDYGYGNGYGAAYLYQRNGGAWTEVARLRPDSLEFSDNFGMEVELSGNQAFIGTPFSLGEESIYVYNYLMDQCSLDTVLMRPDTIKAGAFGISMDYDEDRLLVGSRLDYNKFCYFYRYDGRQWKFNSRLEASEDVYIAPDEGVGTYYGYSVGLSGNTAVVGAPWDDTDQGWESGSISIYGPFVTRVTSHPEEVYTDDTTDHVSFGISGDSIVHCQWQRCPGGDSVFYSLENAAPFKGTDTDTLVIQPDDTLDGDSYRCIASNQNGSDTSKAAKLWVEHIQTDDETSIAKLPLEHVSVYPNPTRGKILLDARSLAGRGPLTISLLNTGGREIERKVLHQSLRTPINMKGHASGVYYLRLKQGNRTGTIKVIKQ